MHVIRLLHTGVLDLVLDDLIDESVLQSVYDDGVSLQNGQQLHDQSGEGLSIRERGDVGLSLDGCPVLLQLLVGEVYLFPS